MATSPVPDFQHEFQISGGRWADLVRIVDREIFYQMQHPRLLDFFVEPGAKLRAIVKDDSALVAVDVDPRSLRIQRSMGRAGPALFEAEIRREYKRRGILAAGLDAALTDRVCVLCPTARLPIEQQVEFSDLAAFDLDLHGNLYKTLRSSLHRAEREGITVEAYDAAAHGASALKVFEEWNSLKMREGTFWISQVLEKAGRIPGLVGAVALRRRKVLGVSMAFKAGDYAYMLLAITRKDHGRAQEVMDYNLMKKLKTAGVRRLDWGISDRGAVSAYKKKYGNILLEPISTFWIPGP